MTMHAPGLFADLPGVTETGEPEHLSLTVTYYDTADLRLARAGSTLCRRTGGTGEGWYATVPIGSRHREVRVPLARSPGEVPAELATLFRAHTGERPLRRTALITVERDVWHLTGADGTALAELADDTVAARALGDVEGPVRTWREVGVRSGPDDLLADDWFARADAIRANEAGRFTRTIGDLLPAPDRARLGADSSGGAVVVAYLRAQVGQVRAADPAVRLDDPDGVHDVRVAVRRLRSCLRVFRRIIDAPPELTAELKWLSDVLGAARDIQVLEGQLAEAVAAVPAGLLLGPVRAGISRQLARRAADADQALREALNGQRYLDLLAALDSLLADPPCRDRAHRRAAQVLPPLVASAYRKCRKAAAAASAEHGQARDAVLHRLRKRTKRLRYAAETVEPVVGAPARRRQRRAKKVQGALGDQHDLVELRPVLRELGVLAHLDGTNGFTFGLMYANAQVAAQDAEQRFDAAWRRLRKSMR
jgi:CHAD domain-containing protein